MKEEDLELLPAGSVVAFMTPGGEPRHLETTKLKDGLWSCNICSENHTSEEVAAFKMVMRLKRVGLPEAEKTEGLTVDDVLERPDRFYYDVEGDLWGSRDGRWCWGDTLEDLERKLSGDGVQHIEPFREGVPYRAAEGVSLPEAEKTPTITELFASLVNSLERIANELEKK